MESNKLTKTQIKNFARIQSALIIMHKSGTEFDESEYCNSETAELCYMEMDKISEKLFKHPDETRLGHTNQIIEYVKQNF